MSVIDEQGYRANVGIILLSDDNRLFWAKRVGQNAWQFPQGGMLPGESLEQAMYRELDEEVGLSPADVQIITYTEQWLAYRLPKEFIRYHDKPVCIGQKQKWFLLRLIAPEQRINLTCSDKPEFDDWRWVEYWYPLKQVIHFKRDVYREALKCFAPYVQEDEAE